MKRLLFVLAAFGAALAPAGLLSKERPRVCPSPVGEPTVAELAPDIPLERTLAPGETHTYFISLQHGDFLRLVADQRGADVVVSLFDPAGRLVLEVDSPNGSQGPEELAAVASGTGSYRLVVRPWSEEAAGGYRVAIEERRPAGRRDKQEAAAVRALAAAERLRERGGAEALRRSLAEYRQALGLWRELADAPREARILHGMGLASFGLGQVDEAARRYEESLAILRRLGGASRQEPELLNDLGTAYRLTGRRTEVAPVYQEALERARATGHRLAEATALNNLGVLHDFQGETRRALRYHEQALAAWRALGNRDGEASSLQNLGVSYSLLGRQREAIDLLERAMALGRADGERRAEAETVTALAWAYCLAGDLTTALRRFDQAAGLWRDVGDRRAAAAVLDRRGTTLGKMGRLPEALADYRRALHTFEAVGDRLSQANTLANLGWLHHLLAQPEQALGFYDRALELFHQTGDGHGEATALLGRAKAERRLGDLDGALRDAAAAVSRLESLRGELEGRALRTSYLATRHSYYELLIDLLMELHGREPGRGFHLRALETAERARARALLDTLLEEAAGGGEAGELPARLAAARARLNAQARRRGEAEEMERELRASLLEVDRLEARVRGTVPGARPLTAGEIQRLVLDEDTLLLEYALGEERSFVWLVGTRGVTVHALPGRGEIEAAALRLHGLLPRSHLPSVAGQARTSARALAAMVLGPVAGGLGTRRLLVVADGALQLVPFAALPSPSSGDEPLLVRHEIVHLPSASVLAPVRRELARRPPAPGLVAVLADPVFSADDPRLGGSGGPASVERGGFARLPYSGAEAAAILRLAPAARRLSALGFQANRELALSGRLGGYRILHFATHGVLDAEHPELSGIVLALYDEQGRRRRDGLVRVHELHGLRWPADLVVLSACRTALGKEVRGEGLTGLTQGLFHAGAGRVVLSLWSVGDRSTAELMARFYRGLLRQGLPPAAALRQAQLELLRDPRWQAPSRWAGFILQGEWR